MFTKKTVSWLLDNVIKPFSTVYPACFITLHASSLIEECKLLYILIDVAEYIGVKEI